MRDNYYKLVVCLSDGNWHTGPELAKVLGVSRAMILNYVTVLKKHDVPIIQHRRSGYALKDAYSLLSSVALQEAFPEDIVTVKHQVDSTNDAVQKGVLTHPFHIYLSESQTQGRGRLGRSWYSPFGQNIYLSIRMKMAMPISELGLLSMGFALALAKHCDQRYGLGFKVKWPNDIWYDGKKCAGVLVEMQGELQGLSDVTMGIGFNVNALDFPSMLNATSLSMITGAHHDRTAFAKDLIHCLRSFLLDAAQSGDVLLEDWDVYDVLLGRSISVMHFNQKIHGTACGIDAQGRLRVRTKSGMQCVASGDATLHDV